MAKAETRGKCGGDVVWGRVARVGKVHGGVFGYGFRFGEEGEGARHTRWFL